MISDKKTVQYLYKFCKDLEIRNWIFSPGSRNAPITLTIANDNYFQSEVVVDERSAGFVALGMSLQSNTYTVLSCTSGTAPLNYASAIAEAYYQCVPLFVVTADRPQKWIGNGEGQSIDQVTVYKNYIYSSYHLDDTASIDEIEEVFNSIANDMNSGMPIHLNLAFDEPLYNKVEKIFITTNFKKDSATLETNSKTSIERLTHKWNSFSRIMIICGQMPSDEKLRYRLNEINQDSRVVVLTETTSNQSDFYFVNCIDRTLANISQEEKYKPQLVVTIGGAIVSKKIKTYIRSTEGLVHWQVSLRRNEVDVFGCLSECIEMSDNKFLAELLKGNTFSNDSIYKDLWLQASQLSKANHIDYLADVEWSDLRVFGILNETLPEEINLHLGNSSPIRYVQLFEPIKSIKTYSNRGVSGIDGCTSTAVGFSHLDKRMNVLILGDLSFVYDNNAFWNHLNAANLKVIVLNNGGGGIFRIIPGPSETNVLEKNFEVGNNADISALCSANQVTYLSASSEVELENNFATFYKQSINSKPVVMEIKTPRKKNSVVLEKYFEYLRKEV